MSTTSNENMREEMREVRQRFENGSLRGQEKRKFPVPTAFGADALRELAENYDGPRRFTALIAARANGYIDLLHENGNRIGCLLEERRDRESELDRLEAKNEQANEQVEAELLSEIRSRFPDADEDERQRLFSWIRSAVGAHEPGMVEERLTAPSLWSRVEDEDLWRGHVRQLNPHKEQARRVGFDLEVLRMVIGERRSRTTVERYELPQREDGSEPFLRNKADVYAKRVYPFLEKLDSIRQLSLHALAAKDDGNVSEAMLQRQSSKEGGWKAPYRVWKDHGYWETGSAEDKPGRMARFKKRVRALVEQGEYPAKPEG